MICLPAPPRTRSRHPLALIAGALAVLLAGAQPASAYFPPPEGKGGWRSLVPHGGTPSASQKAAVRSQAGVDWDRLKRAYDYSRGHASNSAVLVIRKGYVVGEWGSRSPYSVASISKSLTGMAVAKMLDMSSAGQTRRPIGLDSYAYPYLPASWAPAGSPKRQIKIRHLMTMTSGLRPHDQPTIANYRNFILGLPLAHTPGSRWAYASAPVDLLSMITGNVTGRKLRDVFNQHIAGPVGASPVGWGEFAGSPVTGASSEAQVRPRDLARFGYLMMRKGSWNGRRILSSARAGALVDGDHSAHTSFHPTAGSPFRVDSSPQRFYGQLWWTNRTRTALGSKVPADAFYAHGLFERLLIVVPSRDLVVVRYGSSPKSLPSFKREFMGRVMDALVTSS